MSTLRRGIKCICALAALVVLMAGVTAQIDKAAERAAAIGDAVFAASVTEDYTDTDTRHETIQRSGQVVEIEASKEVSGHTNGEALSKRTAGHTDRGQFVRYALLMTILIVAAILRSAISYLNVYSAGSIPAVSRTIISYIHLQGDFAG